MARSGGRTEAAGDGAAGAAEVEAGGVSGGDFGDAAEGGPE